jgi:hypothetical protein
MVPPGGPPTTTHEDPIPENPEADGPPNRGALRDALAAAEDHIALARTVGANPVDAESALADARAAVARDDLVEAWDHTKRAERLAMQGQERQIQKAMRLRDSQTERAHGIIASGEPVVQEAEGYGLDAQEARTLLRQARDVLAKGDSVAGMVFARNAEEAVARLEARLVDERKRRGTEKPTQGVCGACQSDRLHFYDNGWGRCLACGATFRWRRPAGFVDALRGLFGP